MKVPTTDPLVIATSVIVTAWLTAILIYAVRALARGDRRSVLFVYVVFYLFFAMPMVLDATLGPPEYTIQRGMILSQYDLTTNLIYLGYIAFVPMVFRWIAGPPRFDESPRAVPLRNVVRGFSWIAMLALPVVLMLAPSPTDYLAYAAYVAHQHAENADYNQIVGMSAVLAVVGSVLVLTAEDTSPIGRVVGVSIATAGVWIHGKRSIVAIALLLTLYQLWTRGVLRGRRFLVVAAVVAIAFAAFTYAYQTSVRKIGESDTRGTAFSSSTGYVGYRIDFGRDGITKQTIYAELNPKEIQVLEYRGQSILFDLTWFVPRSLWPSKPYPYAVYSTAAMFGIKPRDLGWGVTTSWLEEAIANVGWLGLLLGPAVPALVCRIGDRRRSPLGSLLTVCVGSLLLVLQLIPFLFIFLLWVLMMLRPDAIRPRALPAGAGATVVRGLGRRLG